MRGAVVAAFIAAVLSGSALAQERSSPLPSHLPLKTEACFGKTYDAEYLKQNPKQRVTRFHLFRDFAGRQDTRKIRRSPSGTFLDQDGEGGSVGLMAYVGFRDKPGVFTNWLSCAQEQRRQRQSAAASNATAAASRSARRTLR